MIHRGRYNDDGHLVRELVRQGRRVATVGEGVSDAPALVEAIFGLALVHVGSELAFILNSDRLFW